jgi:hypothetical protein
MFAQIERSTGALQVMHQLWGSVEFVKLNYLLLEKLWPSRDAANNEDPHKFIWFLMTH